MTAETNVAHFGQRQLALDTVAEAFSEPQLAEVFSLSGERIDPTNDHLVPFYLAHGEVQVPGAKEPVKYTISVATDLKSPNLHLIVPGFGGSKWTSKRMRNAFSSEESSAAASYQPARVSSSLESHLSGLLDAQKLHVDTIGAIIDDLPQNKQLEDLPNHSDISLDKVVLDAHSMGFIAASRYALAHPQNVALINSIAGVGLEEPSPGRFARRYLPAIKDELLPAIMQAQFGEDYSSLDIACRAIRYYGRNPLRTVGEMISCMVADVRPQMTALRILGVKLGMLCLEKDKLLPPKLSIEGASQLVDHYEVILDAGHIAPQTKPLEVAHRLSQITHRLLFSGLKV
ncbi:MAG TPA: alpha/beta hydrolase [Candidatus Dormibacteraeota bacterium]|nr:alpha/beta hydrolase [Candidatus Dormibacteraeota bacterium]